MFSLANTHAVVSIIRQEHFLDPTVHPSSTSFSVMSCKTPWKSCPHSLSHSSPPVHSETHSSCFTLTVLQKLYLPKSKVTSVIQIQRSAEAFYLAHQLGLTWLTVVSSTLNLASRILSFLGFPPTLPAAPSLSLYLICPLLPIFFSCSSAPRFSCWSSSLLLFPSFLEISASLMAWKISSERLITPKFLSPTQTPFLNSRPLFPITYSVSSVVYCTCLKLNVCSSPGMAASPTDF